LIFSSAEYEFLESGRKNMNPVVRQNTPSPVTVTKYRMSNCQFAHPLLLIDVGDESEDMQSLKSEITSLIESKKNSGEITSASVFVKRMNDSHWISINNSEGYNPGSLIKVPVMMTYLREAEKTPSLMQRKFELSPNTKVPHQTFNEETIVPGKSYTVKELLCSMIAKSDNYATLLLNQNLNIDAFKNLFADVGLQKPDVTSRSFTVTAADYSKFLRVLYNATYITDEDADYALSLLTQCSFKDGLMKGIPDGIKVSHKFGEWGEIVPGGLHQLHESGIVYFDNDPYLITIMTKGNDVKLLPQVIAEISKLAFNGMTGNKAKS
jgi:beta-lactamase class A